MTKRTKHLLAILLALVLTVGTAVSVLAASTATYEPVTGISVKCGNGTNCSSSYADGAVTATAQSRFMGLGNYGVTNKHTNTITITNIGSEEATIKFDYECTANANIFQFDDIDWSTRSGTYSVTLAAGGTLKVEVQSPDGSANTATLTLKNFERIVSANFSMSFSAVTNGTATADGNDLAQGYTATVDSAVGIPVTAAPASGYSFVAWVDSEDNILSVKANDTLFPTANCTVKPLFVATSNTDGLWSANKKLWTNLNEAANAALSGNKEVLLLKDATLPAGDYTIPAGVTVLVPFDANYSLYTESPVAVKNNGSNPFVKPYVYRTLTLSEGVNLNVLGNLSISAKYAGGESMFNCGVPTGAYGHVYMEGGSNITVSGGLYVWGYITGDGVVTANSGANVYENIQFYDFRGGSAISSILGVLGVLGGDPTHDVFPFSQYYVQNIETKLVLHSGATEYAVTAIALNNEEPISTTVKFIGTSDAMFLMDEGTTVTKEYVPETDRLILTVDGNMAMGSMSVSAAGMTLNSSKFKLPINSNITIQVNSGMISVTQDLDIHPGAQIIVGEAAMVEIASGYNVFLYDRDDFVGKKFVYGNTYYTTKDYNLIPAAYSATPGRKVRTAADMLDAQMDINGYLFISGGLYTSNGGAAITSSQGTGKVLYMADPGSVSTTKQLNQSGSNITAINVSVTVAKLQHGNGSYLATAGAVSGDGYRYNTTTDQWEKVDGTVSLDMNGAPHNFTQEELQNYIDGMAILFGDGNVYTVPAIADYFDGTIASYFKGWNTKADGSGIAYCAGDEITVTGPITLYAQWTDVEITWIIEGQQPFTSEHKMGAIPVCPMEPTKNGDGKHVTYTFAGWKIAGTDDSAILAELPAVTQEAAYEAVFTKNTSDCVDDDKNHACDICGTAMGTCGDADKDHVCDYGCDKPYGDHVQAEGKHTCDYCSQTMSECEDTDKDHDCDTCGANMGIHAGTSNSHTCTYCGKPASECSGGEANCLSGAICEICGNVYTDKDSDKHTDLGVRVEANADKTHSYYHVCCDKLKETVSCVAKEGSHNCGTCNNVLTACADANNDHNCDICGEKLNDCIDSNKNHACDICGTAMGEHIQAAGKHTCDYCGQTMSDCSDANNDRDHKCDICGKDNITACAGGIANCINPAYCSECAQPYGEKNPNNHAKNTYLYVNHGENHTVKYACCKVEIETVAHSYTDGKCACGDIQKFTITWKNENGSVIDTTTVSYGEVPSFNGIEPTKTATAEYTFAFAGWGTVVEAKEDAVYTASFTATPRNYEITFAIPYVDSNGDLAERREVFTVPFGANLSDYLPELPEKLAMNNIDLYQGVFTIDGWDLDETTMPAYDVGTVRPNMNYTGWVRGEGAAVYMKDTEQVFGTWIILGEDFLPAETGTAYYLDENGFAVTGIVRVPYPTAPINDITYAPNAEDLANGDKYGYTDATSGLFVFDQDGKFQQDLNGLYGANWAVNGQLPWHVGLVQSGSDYYYFVGENKMAVGNIYVSRNSTNLDVTIGGVYTFSADGKLCKYHGIARVNGTLYYYENCQLMMGYGLVKVDNDYYYVRSNGALVVNTEYWIADNNGLDVQAGSYKFDENGKLMNPISENLTGVVAENGDLFYYVDGQRVYAGLIEYNGGYIYVRSNGQLAVGRYWITKHNDVKAEGYYEFGADGMMLDQKDGFVEENGEIYYYVDGRIQYAAGLIEVEGEYYYVKSNGALVRNGAYWITNVNDTGIKAGNYSFDANGVMTLPEHYGQNGIIDGYYYEDGKIVCGAGLIEYNGGYIYVRSNGMVATGKYWVTNNNGLMESGIYNFGADGMMIQE